MVGETHDIDGFAVALRFIGYEPVPLVEANEAYGVIRYVQ